MAEAHNARKFKPGDFVVIVDESHLFAGHKCRVEEVDHITEVKPPYDEVAVRITDVPPGLEKVWKLSSNQIMRQ